MRKTLTLSHMATAFITTAFVLSAGAASACNKGEEARSETHDGSNDETKEFALIFDS